MEIRRCDKCNADIDPKQLEAIDYYGSDDDGKAMKIDVPVMSSVADQKVADPGTLDDRDDFGSLVTHHEIDLCYNCSMDLANMIQNWIKASK